MSLQIGRSDVKDNGLEVISSGGSMNACGSEVWNVHRSTGFDHRAHLIAQTIEAIDLHGKQYWQVGRSLCSRIVV